MKKTIYVIAIVLSMLLPRQTMAECVLDSLQLKVRAGYEIGGTSPIPLPATIRSIDSYKLTPSFMVGFDAEYPIDCKWGVLAGVHVENKGMDGKVTTKAYKMDMRRGDSRMDGLFTGKVHQKVRQWMVTIPVQATFNVSQKVKLKGGPYLSVLFDKNFDGIASDGYLRQGTPVGAKILIGSVEGEWATYDFSEEMRTLQFGLDLGVDWQVGRKIGVSADLSWGLTGIFKRDFKTVEQTLYPIYFTIGAFYKLK